MSNIASLLTADRPVTWLFAGDSITHGAVHTLGWRDYTELFDERLYELGRAEDIVINSAVSGWNVGLLHSRIEDRVLRFKPDAVFIMYGTNDAVAGLDGIDGFHRAYGDAIARIRDAGIEHIVVQTTLPMMPLDAEAFTDLTDQPDAAARERSISALRMRMENIPVYVEATREIAARHDVTFIDHWPVWTSAGTVIGHLTEGAFHPDEYGHRLIAHTIFRELGMWDLDSRVCRLSVP